MQLPSIIILLLTSLSTGIHGAPYDPVPSPERNDSSSSSSNKSIITTTIHAANGTDISSSFRTMIYWQQPQQEEEPTNTTTTANTTDLATRQVSTARQINTCRSHSSLFMQSHCKHSQHAEVSLREYIVFCQEIPPLPPQFNPDAGTAAAAGEGGGSSTPPSLLDDDAVFPLQPLITVEEGSCAPHEICMNDVRPRHPLDPATGRRSSVTATCIDIDEFFQNPDPRHQDRRGGGAAAQDPHAETEEGGGSRHGASNDPATAGGGGGVGGDDDDHLFFLHEDGFDMKNGWLVERGIGNRRASVIVSTTMTGPDNNTTNGIRPLGLEKLEVDTGSSTGASAGADSGSGGKVQQQQQQQQQRQQQTCEHCFGLRTRKAATDADFLSTKATLMATTALTGIVWITVFSG